MIVGVRGVLEAAGPDWVHLSVGGVTLQISVPGNAIPKLGIVGATVSLHTLLRIRDEQPVLYGFPDAVSLSLFALLNGVSGVGPRLALSLLSELEPASLQLAVASGDATALAAAPGVGRRTAGRIILELKDKIEPGDGLAVTLTASEDNEVLAALSALGYSANEAKAALDKLPSNDGLSVEDRIRLALQQFATRG